MAAAAAVLPRFSFAEVVSGKLSVDAPSSPRSLAKSFAEVFKKDGLSKVKTPGTFRGEPALFFSKEEISKLATPFRFTLIGKFSFGRPSMEIIRKFFVSLGLKSLKSVGLLHDNHVAIFISSEEDYSRLLFRSIWYISGVPMKVFKWSPDFFPNCESPIVPVWIGFPGLPLHFFDKTVLFSLASVFGDPLKTDEPTSLLSRPTVARVCVDLDVSKQRGNKVWLGDEKDGFWQEVVFENPPSYCGYCLKIGHSEDSCFVKNPELKLPKEKNKKDGGKPGVSIAVPEQFAQNVVPVSINKEVGPLTVDTEEWHVQKSKKWKRKKNKDTQQQLCSSTVPSAQLPTDGVLVTSSSGLNSKGIEKEEGLTVLAVDPVQTAPPPFKGIPSSDLSSFSTKGVSLTPFNPRFPSSSTAVAGISSCSLALSLSKKAPSPTSVVLDPSQNCQISVGKNGVKNCSVQDALPHSNPKTVHKSGVSLSFDSSRSVADTTGLSVISFGKVKPGCVDKAPPLDPGLGKNFLTDAREEPDTHVTAFGNENSSDNPSASGSFVCDVNFSFPQSVGATGFGKIDGPVSSLSNSGPLNFVDGKDSQPLIEVNPQFQPPNRITSESHGFLGDRDVDFQPTISFDGGSHEESCRKVNNVSSSNASMLNSKPPFCRDLECQPQVEKGSQFQILFSNSSGAHKPSLLTPPQAMVFNGEKDFSRVKICDIKSKPPTLTISNESGPHGCIFVEKNQPLDPIKNKFEPLMEIGGKLSETSCEKIMDDSSLSHVGPVLFGPNSLGRPETSILPIGQHLSQINLAKKKEVGPDFINSSGQLSQVVLPSSGQFLFNSSGHENVSQPSCETNKDGFGLLRDGFNLIDSRGPLNHCCEELQPLLSGEPVLEVSQINLALKEKVLPRYNFFLLQSALFSFISAHGFNVQPAAHEIIVDFFSSLGESSVESLVGEVTWFFIQKHLFTFINGSGVKFHKKLRKLLHLFFMEAENEGKSLSDFLEDHVDTSQAMGDALSDSGGSWETASITSSAF